MNSAPPDFTVFEAVTGLITIVSFLAIGFFIATLRSHVDEAKARKEESLASLFRSPIPPEHILTETGKRRVKGAKIALGVLVITLATIVTHNLIYAS